VSRRTADVPEALLSLPSLPSLSSLSSLLALLSVLALGAGLPAAASAPEAVQAGRAGGAEAVVHRAAVVVGSNRAIDGREGLRYAHADARRVADALADVGGFARGDVAVLLDAAPAAVLAEVDRRLASLAGRKGRSLLVFYYSGHASADALFPGGQELPLAALRTRLEREGATVRVGILDACRGGGWTRSKGLTPVRPFSVSVPEGLASEGSAFIASSSGLQDAHESDALQGSFFTHHLVAGLRGAADRSGEGEVTLDEAFTYARERTVRDSVLHAPTPQTPSFDVQLRGREALALARVPGTGALLRVQQQEGPLELVDLRSGVTVLELAPGARTVRLALTPGAYVLRRRTAGGLRARELSLAPGQALAVAEADLTLVGTDALSRKGGADEERPVVPGPHFATTLPAGRVQVSARGGRAQFLPAGRLDAPFRGGMDFLLSQLEAFERRPKSAAVTRVAVGLTDRLELGASFAGGLVTGNNLVFHGLGADVGYRLGEPAALEWTPWGRLMLGDPQRFTSTASLRLALGVDARLWAGPRSRVEGGLEALVHDFARPLSVPLPMARVGYTHHFGEDLSVHLALGAALERGPDSAAVLYTPQLGLGSLPSVGRRAQPLVRWRVLEWLALEGHAELALLGRTGNEAYMAGVSGVF
jgi:hypothetical protein